MKLLSHYPQYLRSHGRHVKFPVTRKGETTPIFEKEKKEDPGSHRLVSTLCPAGS